jgi:hypothetical protein
MADLFSFNPAGTGAGGAITNAAIIDEAPGNLLSLGTGGAIVVGQQSTGLYQANLAAIEDVGSVPLFANGTGGHYFTFAASLPEVVTSVSAGTAQFALGNTGPNVFQMFATTTPGDNLAGTGFTTGTQILSAHAIALTSTFGLTAAGAGAAAAGCPGNVGGFATGNLDQSPNGNQWGAQQTVCGTGSTDITLVVDSASAAYFPGLFTGATFVFHFANTSQVDPFKQVDPSLLFSQFIAGAFTNGNYANTHLGAINGLSAGCGSTFGTGCDFVFQADANGSFTVQRVPEPASLALVGLGLAAMGGLAWRKRQNS